MRFWDADTWDFGGPLAGAPPDAGWAILAAAGGLCVLFAWVSYRTAVRKLGLFSSGLLMLLRAAFLAVLLLCLANPVRIERETRAPSPVAPSAPSAPGRLAVVVDRSDSMTLPDNRGRSRLDEALANWRRIEKVAATKFASTEYYSFGQDLQPAQTLEEALARVGGTDQTRLYRSLSTILRKAPAERPSAIVVLTDGVDTSNDTGAESTLREEAVTAGVPIYFVAGTNRAMRPDPFLRVREWRVPSVALRNTRFPIEVVFEAFSRAERTVPYSIWQGGRQVAGGDLQLTLGTNVITHSIPVTVGDAVPVEFEVRLGAGDRATTAARAVTRVVEAKDKRIHLLLYEGDLDWGFRHINEALRADQNFDFATLVSSNAGVTFVKASTPGTPLLGQLPEKVSALQRFDCVVLLRPDPRRISPAQQQALAEFVRQGGALFFVSPDPAALPLFAGGPLQEILPVVLDPREVPAAGVMNKLIPMELTDAGRAKPIFRQGTGTGNLLPRFQEYAAASRIKPGGEILAVHPTATNPVTGQKHILFALQPFGLGRSAILMTDSLWRWRLDEPSTSRVVGTFWQQALLAVGQPPDLASMRFLDLPAEASLAQPIKFRISTGPADAAPEIVAKGPDGRLVQLPVTPTVDADARWRSEWVPNQAGAWELMARQQGAYNASAFLTVVAGVTGELARSVPALPAMAAFAGDTGGKLLNQEPPTEWLPEEKAKQEKAAEPVVVERHRSTWSQWHLLLAALGFYALELILRRVWKLL